MSEHTALRGWQTGQHTADGVTHATFRKDPGSGPAAGVIVIHEVPGITPEVAGFGEELVAAGHTVVMPHLFGAPGAPVSVLGLARVMPRVCVSREFTAFALGRTPPVATWLRSLARELHAELGGPGVGALGMCFTGGFALAMMVDPAVAAPVVAQPSLPFALGRRRAADLNLSPTDLQAVKERAAAGCAVLGVRYAGDRATGTRFATLERLLGDAFTPIELPGSKHSTLTAHRSQRAVDEVVAFFGDRLLVRS